MPRRSLTGRVVSKSGDKTIVVRVERRVTHPLYKKTIRRSKKYHAHDPENKIEIGSIVNIRECAPISKMKKWEIINQSSNIDG